MNPGLQPDDQTWNTRARSLRSTTDSFSKPGLVHIASRSFHRPHAHKGEVIPPTVLAVRPSADRGLSSRARGRRHFSKQADLFSNSRFRSEFARRSAARGTR